ncbi:hypothetical protein YC2023_099851 [Brassica napus]
MFVIFVSQSFSLSNGLLSPYTGGNISSDFCGSKLCSESLNPLNLLNSNPKRGVVTMVFVAVADLLCCRGSDGSCNRADRLERLDICNGKNVQAFHLLYLFSKGSAHEQPPPDLALYLFKNRVVYLGMSLVPSVTELILAEFLYLQYEDEEKPIYLYINSTGTTNLGYDTEAFAIYDVMGYVKPPIFTLCVRNAWREAALLLTAGAKGNCSALPS